MVSSCFFFFFLLQEFNSEPVIPVYSARPEQVGKALKHVYTAALKLKGKELELLLAILPDNNGSLYGTFFFTCTLDHMQMQNSRNSVSYLFC